MAPLLDEDGYETMEAEEVERCFTVEVVPGWLKDGRLFYLCLGSNLGALRDFADGWILFRGGLCADHGLEYAVEGTTRDIEVVIDFVTGEIEAPGIGGATVH